MINEIIKYNLINSNYILISFFKHLLISFYGVFFATIIGVPLGFFIIEKKYILNIIMTLINIIQTIPSLAMLAILMIFFGIGANTVVIAVFLYSLLPIIKNTISGIQSIPIEILSAAKGMGMTKIQVILKVKIPLSISIIMGGIKNALIVAIGITAVGTFIGSGGLGDIITRGINVSNGIPIIISGVILTTFMSIIADVLLSFLENKLNEIYKIT